MTIFFSHLYSFINYYHHSIVINCWPIVMYIKVRFLFYFLLFCLSVCVCVVNWQATITLDVCVCGPRVWPVVSFNWFFFSFVAHLPSKICKLSIGNRILLLYWIIDWLSNTMTLQHSSSFNFLFFLLNLNFWLHFFFVIIAVHLVLSFKCVCVSAMCLIFIFYFSLYFIVWIIKFQVRVNI